MSEHPRYGVDDAGEMIEAAKGYLIAGARGKDFTLLRAGMVLWHLAGTPFWVIKQVTRLIIKNDKHDYPQKYE